MPIPASVPLEGPPAMRTVIYARFSSTLQNARSIEDQVALCRDRIAREGWEEVGIFTDYAISGAAGIDENARPGLNAMLARIEQGGVDQVLAEATDRIARHQGDAFAIRERVTFAGARIFTLSDGEVTEITATFRGLMDAQFRKDLGAKVRRGQRGTISQKRSPAGKAYGYRLANRIEADGRIVRGLREIAPDEAAIVLRIFTEYAADLSPRMIAARLNSEGVPGPTGGTWRTSTIAGDRQRRNGILQNRLYAGVLVHNRTSKITDPRTRKTRIRPNPESEWISEPVEDLRIVPEELWHQVQQRRSSRSEIRPELQRRPRHLLSGLVECGVCGGGYTVASLRYWGCGRHRDGRGCSNGRKIAVQDLERRVLAGLQDHMLDPELVRIYVIEYHRNYAKVAQQIARDRGRVERRLAEATARVNRLVEAIAAGGDAFEEIRGILLDARAKREALKMELAEIDSVPIIALHPNIADRYRENVAQLASTLASPENRVEALPRARALISRVIVAPDETRSRGVKLEVQGRLAELLSLATGTPPAAPDLTITVERVRGIEPL